MKSTDVQMIYEVTAHEVYYESLRDLFPGFDVDCFMRKPIENENLLRKVLSAI